jgi:lipooligosaccharide transport system permease protein
MSGANVSIPEELVAAPGAKPRRYGSWYVAEHRLLGMKAYAQTIIATGIGTPVLYLYALGVGLATLVDPGLGSGEVSYLTFVAPALLATAAVTVATEEFTYPVMVGFKWNPVFFGMNAAPIQSRQIVDGIIIAVTIRMVVQTIIYYLFMLVFGAVPGALGVLTIATATLTGLASGLLIMAYACSIVEDKGQFAMLMRFLVLPLTLFSGTFFPLDALPVYLHWIGWLSPLWHGAELSRVFAYGMAEPIWLTVTHVAYLLALSVWGWLVARRITARRLNK